jgi:cell division initiation protein
MRITPLDVRKQEFNKSMRGFDCDEVQAFLHTLADEYEAVLIDSKQIRDRVMEQDEKISEYTDLEKTLRDTLMTAERVMQDTKETASHKGELIVQEAELKAKIILEECRIRTEELRREIIGLRKEKENYLGRFRSLAQAQIQFIDTHESDFEEMDKRLLDIVDNVTVKPAPVHPVGTSQANISNPEVLAFDPVQEKEEASASLEYPAVAPVPIPAPVNSENDVWRDYNPGGASEAQATPEVATAETGQTERLNSDMAPESDSNFNEHEGKIADILSESLSETDHDPTEELVDFITSDVVEPATEVEPSHDPVNV